MVSDPTQRGLVAAQRVAEMSKELDINIENAYLIINRLPAEMHQALADFISTMDIPLLGVIPADSEITNFDFNGRPLVEINGNSPVCRAVSEMMDQIL